MKSAIARASLLDFFQRYIDAGFSTVPIRHAAKDALTRWKSAQTSLAPLPQATKWIDNYGTSIGIGIVTGTISGLVVLDVDSPDADPEMMAMLRRNPTTVVATSRGAHHYYTLPEGLHIPTKPQFVPGIDCKGEGGYVVAPPAVHATGHVYSFQTPLADIQPLPDEIRERIFAHTGVLESYTEFGETKWRAHLQGAKEGERNNSAASIIGKFVEKIPEELWEFAWGALQEWNTLNQPPLELSELRKTYNSICAKEKRKRMAARAAAQIEVKESIRLSTTALREYETPKFAISDLLIEGTTMLVGKPKRGKSVLTLQMSLAVASGRAVFENGLLQVVGSRKFKATQGDVLYLALEDNEARFVRRARDLYRSKALPAALHMSTTWPLLTEGGISAMHNWVDANPDARLIVIDSLTAFLGVNSSSNIGAFKADYHVMRPIFDFSQERRIAVLVIHHARKSPGRASEVDDPMDAISGTLGGVAAADTYLLMERALDSEYALLHVAGRDVPSYKVALHQPRPEDVERSTMGRFALGDIEALIAERRGKK